MVWFRSRTFEHEVVEILVALCRGGAKAHVVRVLPADILPKKVYSLPAQEGAVSAYLEGGRGLRGTLAEFEGEVPDPSTLHAWVGAMGRYARERAPDPPSGPLFAEVRGEIEDHFLPGLSRIWDEAVVLDPARYQPGNERRRDDLEGAFRLLRVAQAAFPDQASPLVELVRSLLACTDLVTPPCWWARIRGPPSNTMGRRSAG